MQELLDDVSGAKKRPAQLPLRSLQVLSAFVVWHWTVLVFDHMTLLRNWPWGAIHLLAFLANWGTATIAILALRHHPDRRLWLYAKLFLGATLFTLLYMVGIATAGHRMPAWIDQLQRLIEQSFYHLPLLLVLRYWRQQPKAGPWWPTLEQWAILLTLLNLSNTLWHRYLVEWGAPHVAQSLVHAGFALVSAALLFGQLKGQNHLGRVVLGWTWMGINLILLAIYAEGTLNYVEEILIVLGTIFLLVASRKGMETAV